MIRRIRLVLLLSPLCLGAVAKAEAPKTSPTRQNPFRPAALLQAPSVRHDPVDIESGAEVVTPPPAFTARSDVGLRPTIGGLTVDGPPTDELTIDVSLPAGKLPDDPAGQRLADVAPRLGRLPRPWPATTYAWAAAATRHQPLYFEEANVERYGYTRSRFFQPAISVAHFFGTLPAIPYLKGADCPWECQYTLGQYRPGSCNPWQTHWWPVSLRGAAVQGGVVTGTAFVIP